MRRPVLLLAVVGLLGCSSSSSTAPTTTAGAPPATTSGSTTTVTQQPPATGEGGAEYKATIRRTTDGVPHITADTLADAVFGQGYANAEDHGCTLADAILTPLSQRAAAFGAGTDDKNVASDFAWKRIGLAERATADFAEASDEATSVVEAYAAGWNARLADGEFTGWCAGDDWVRPITPVELYVYIRSITVLASSTALAKYIPSAAPPSGAGAPAQSVAMPVDGLVPPAIASNAWAFGSNKTTGGVGGILLANPHFPWEGSLRFWEVQLTVPGQLDVYGAMLIGLPGVGIGFTEGVAWSHTVSAGKRFTAYTLTLDPTDPTRYLVDGTSVPMTSEEYSVDVRQPDGSTTTEKRTLWASEYGPILDFPGVGWSSSTVITFRDANIDNTTMIDQYLAMDSARSLDELIAAHEKYQGIPLFNTIAAGRDGRAWYADTSATPRLSAEAEAIYVERRANDPLTQLAAQNGAVLLDGSDSRFRWEEVPGARSPGLEPFTEMPQLTRFDYVFNANDSFWLANPEELLEGNFTILHGEQRTERSLRTRENARVLAASGEGTPAGADGTFTAAEVRDAALLNMGGAAGWWREAVVARCTNAAVVDVDELAGSDGSVALPAEAVDVGPACDVLGAWDGRYDRDSRGAVLWHEFLSAVNRDAPGHLGALWAAPFDPTDPVGTPNGLSTGADTIVLSGLARAVQTMTKAGLALDVPFGDVKYALRDDPRIGLGGGTGLDGVTNVIDYGNPSNTTEPMKDPGPRLVPGSDLRPDGYPVDVGTSFLLNVDFSKGAPQAWAILTYGETGDRTSDLFSVQTRRFGDKDWRKVAYTEADIAADPALTEKTVTG